MSTTPPPPPPPSAPPPPPDAPRENDTETASRPWWKRWWVILIGVIVLFAVIGSLGGDEDDGTPTAAENSPTATETPDPVETTEPEPDPTTAEPEPEPEPTTEDEPPQPTFAFGPEELQDRWTRATQEFETPNLELKDFNVDDSGVRTVFRANIAPTVEMLGSIIDGQVAEIMTLSQGSSESSENAEVIFSWGLLIATAHPDLPPDARGEVLDELGVNDASDFTNDGHEATVVRDDVEFSLRFSEVIGWSMIATPAG